MTAIDPPPLPPRSAARAGAALAPALLWLVLLASCVDRRNFWPVEDTGQAHGVGNSSREFQQYTGAPYYHSGIDVREPPAPGGPWLRSVDSGSVAISYSGSPIYHGIIITTANNLEFGYWHVDSASIPLAVLNAWNNGTTLARDVQIGQIVNWPACDFHHVHFYRRRPAGETDPMLHVRPNKEAARPTVANVRLARNATDTYFPGSTVDGDVDIVAEISDSIFTTSHLSGAYNVSYKIERERKLFFLRWWQDVLEVDSIFRRNFTPPNASASVVYKTTGPFQSSSNYCGTEVYHYVVTNGIVSGFNDAAGFWDTDGGRFPNGRYRIKVTARDAAGNRSSRSLVVRVAN